MNVEIPIGEVEVNMRLVAADSGIAHRVENVERDGGQVRVKPVGLAWSPWCLPDTLVMVRS